MSLRTPTTCPVCGGDYEIKSLSCSSCHSELTGNFVGCSFCGLSDEESNFVLSFLKCGGSIKEMEKELGISYPTVKNRLASITEKLGLKSVVSPEEKKAKRLEIIEELNSGNITPDVAARLIKEI